MKRTAILGVISCVLTWMTAMAEQTPIVASSAPIEVPDKSAAAASQSNSQPLITSQINQDNLAPMQAVNQAPSEKPEYSGRPNVPDPSIILQGGDTFFSATLINTLPFYDNGFTTGYSDDYNSCAGGGSSPDVVYKYIPTTDIFVDISLCSGTNYDSKLYVCINADPNNLYACSDDGCGDPDGPSELNYLSFLAGTEYYIVVDGYYSSGNYGIEITGVNPFSCGSYIEGYFNGYPDGVNGLTAFRSVNQTYDRWIVDDMLFAEGAIVTDLHWYAAATAGFNWNETGDFIILTDINGAPGEPIYQANDVPTLRQATGNTRWNANEYIYSIGGLNIPLPAGIYWLGVRPVSNSSPNSYSETTSPVNGSPLYVSYPDLNRPMWTSSQVAFGANYDISFCVTIAPRGCQYLVGDINGNGSSNGVDVVYGVSYFKGGNPPPVDCYPVCPDQPNPFYAAGDVNGNCSFNGVDVTYYVAYLKGLQPILQWCGNCPPVSIEAPASRSVSMPELKLDSKTNTE